jgi:hypothetical protein
VSDYRRGGGETYSCTPITTTTHPTNPFPALSGSLQLPYTLYYNYSQSYTMYRQAMLARTALRATRARGFATASDASAGEFAQTRQAVREHAVGMCLQLIVHSHQS